MPEEIITKVIEYEIEDNLYTALVEISTKDGLYGEDSNGNRGIYREFIDDIDIVNVRDDNNNSIYPVPFEHEFKIQDIVRESLE